MSAALITDVSPRDGLQNDPVVLGPEIRAELCHRLAASGLARIEAVSFVSPRHVPAMAGAEEVMAALGDLDPGLLSGLVLNERGFERAVNTGLRQLNLSIAVTETFCQRNQGCSRVEAEALVAELAPRAAAAGVKLAVTIAVSFGCPFEGRVAPEQTLALVERVAASQPDEIVLADTIGVAVPAAVRSLIAAAITFGTPVGGHFHDTRNTGIANCLAALEVGASGLDASAGGVGGCPFAPGATGNVSTEDLVYVLEESGVTTGIDLDSLIACGHWLSEELGHPIPSAVSRAGGFPHTQGP
ncbi:MAG: hydroxymethylglutaryl-CoA lyase [Actinomycetota bacterium]|nr:hydroxymethylglutaryl-CoA lyase [Actinomycetota bacterium]